MADNVTIDTNVFVHLFNPEQNTEEHIDRLLEGLVRQKRSTCYDTGKNGRIESEYTHQLAPIIRSRKSEGARMELLRYFFVLSPRCYVVLDFGSALGVAIRNVMNAVGAEPSDHVFAYVACHSDSPLITNNTAHFPRAELRTCACAHGSAGSDFYDTRTAIGALLPA